MIDGQHGTDQMAKAPSTSAPNTAMFDSVVLGVVLGAVLGVVLGVVLGGTSGEGEGEGAGGSRTGLGTGTVAMSTWFVLGGP